MSSVRISIGGRRVVDRRVGLVARRVTVSSPVFRVAWYTTGFTAPPKSYSVVGDFVYDGDAGGFPGAVAEYLERLADARGRAGDAGLKRSLKAYAKKLAAEARRVADVAEAVKYAAEVGELYRAFGRFLGAIGGPFHGLRASPPVLLWWSPLYEDYTALRVGYGRVVIVDNGEVRVGVYDARVGGRIYCIDYLKKGFGDSVLCNRVVWTTLGDSAGFESLVMGVVEALQVNREAASVLSRLAHYIEMILEAGHSDGFANTENLSLAKTYSQLLSAD